MTKQSVTNQGKLTILGFLIISCLLVIISLVLVQLNANFQAHIKAAPTFYSPVNTVQTPTQTASRPSETQAAPTSTLYSPVNTIQTPTQTISKLPDTQAAPTSTVSIIQNTPVTKNIPAGYHCDDLDKVKLKIGDKAKVGIRSVNLRKPEFYETKHPFTTQTVITILITGQQVEINKGPNCFSYGTWWYVHVVGNNLEGWVREYLGNFSVKPEDYYLLNPMD